jgi:cytochrome P450
MARLEMRVALEELLSRTTTFSVGGEVLRSVYPSDGLATFRLSAS